MSSLPLIGCKPYNALCVRHIVTTTGNRHAVAPGYLRQRLMTLTPLGGRGMPRNVHCILAYELGYRLRGLGASGRVLGFSWFCVVFAY